jgi:cell division protein FtsB
MTKHLRRTDAVVRKLHGWELDHLRELVEEQRAQIERLAADNERLQAEVYDLEGTADMWRDLAARDLADDEAFGVTRDGRACVVAQPQQHQSGGLQ